MAGTKNDVIVAKNADFTQINAPNASSSESNGLITNGQIWIGSTATNVGGTHVNVGTITSPTGTVTIGYSSPNITLASGSSVATVYNEDVGSATPVGGILNLAGAHGINTLGSGSTVTTAINNAITLGDLSAIGAGSSALTATTGDITISSGNLNLPNTASANVGVVEVNSLRFMHSFGTNNTFLGANTGNFTLTAQAATAVGTAALGALTSGLRNSAVGNGALQLLQSGGDNVAIGTSALASAVSASFNTAVGTFALNLCTVGGNTAVGQASLGNNIIGVQCAALGYRALELSTGDNNTGLGALCLPLLTSGGGNNTAVGTASGFTLLTGTQNLFLGAASGFSYTSSESSNILLMNSGTVAESNTIRIGTQGSGAAQQNRAFMAGVASVAVSSALPVVVNSSTGQLGTAILPTMINDVANLGITLSAGTFTVTGFNATALSSTNPAYVTLPSKANPGRTVTYTITADQTFIDDSGSSTIIGNLFGLTTGIAFDQDVPFYIYAVGDDAETAISFMISRYPAATYSPASANIGKTGSAVADTQGSFFALGNPTVTSYDNNPCRCIGAFRMRMSSSDDWTVQTLSDGSGFGTVTYIAADGIGQFHEASKFTMALGQFGARAASYWKNNGGTAPEFVTNEFFYYVAKSGLCTFYLNNSNTTGHAGAGAVTALLALPFLAQNSTPIGSFLGVLTAATYIGTSRSASGTNDLVFVVINTAPVTVQNALFNAAAGTNVTIDGTYAIEYI